MGIQFNADEVLAVAEKIEENGTRFYEAAAGHLTDSAGRRLLLDLAARERTHARTFAAMRSGLAQRARENPTFDPAGEEADYLEALSNASVFRRDDDPVARLGPHPSYRDILITAAAMEKESIVFYVGLKDLVPAPAGGASVDEILREEMRHLTTLNRELLQGQRQAGVSPAP